MSQSMQPGQGYTQEDFSQPAFCRVCGTHVPKSYLAASGGFCANCLHNLQQMHQPMAPQGMGYPGAYRPSPGNFFRSTGFVALLVGLVALGLLGIGASKFLKFSPHVAVGGSSQGVPAASQELAGSQGSKLDQPIDDDTANDLRTMALQEINNDFGQEVVTPGDVGTQAVRDKLTNQTTYYAGGMFECNVNGDKEHITWQVTYVRDDQGKWRMLNRQAYYQTDDGVAQFDFDAKAFIHLKH